MRGSNGQTAAVLSRKFASDLLEPFDFTHDCFHRLQHGPTRFGQAPNTFAMSGKNIDAQFFFKLDNRLGYARLGCKQGFGRLRQIKILPYSLAHKT